MALSATASSTGPGNDRRLSPRSGTGSWRRPAAGWRWSCSSTRPANERPRSSGASIRRRRSAMTARSWRIDQDQPRAGGVQAAAGAQEQAGADRAADTDHLDLPLAQTLVIAGVLGDEFLLQNRIVRSGMVDVLADGAGFFGRGLGHRSAFRGGGPTRAGQGSARGKGSRRTSGTVERTGERSAPGQPSSRAVPAGRGRPRRTGPDQAGGAGRRHP